MRANWRHIFLALGYGTLSACEPNQNYYASLPVLFKGCYAIADQVRYCPEGPGWEPFELNEEARDEIDEQARAAGFLHEEDGAAFFVVFTPLCDENGDCEELDEGSMLSFVPAMQDGSNVSNVKAFDQSVQGRVFLTAQGRIDTEDGDVGSVVVSTALIGDHLLEAATFQFGQPPSDTDHDHHRAMLRSLQIDETEG